MKKKKIVCIFSIILLLFICVLGVKALEGETVTHRLEIEGILCSKDLYQDEDAYDIFENCREDYLNGMLNDYILKENDSVDPGDIVLFIQKYIYGGNSEVEAYTTYINYNSKYWRNDEYEGEEYLLSYFDEEDYPTGVRNNKWKDISVDYIKSGLITASGYSYKDIALNKNTNLFMFALIVKDDAPAGTKLSVSLDKNYSSLLKVSENRFDKKNYTNQDLILRVSGDNSYINNIVSNEYTIKRDEETHVVYGAEPETTIKEFISNFENDENKLFIYDKNGELITDYNKYVGSYMTIKLIDNEEKDALTIVVKGDFDGNGLVDNSEGIYLNFMILGRFETDYIKLQIGDINLDGRITVGDSIAISNYLSGRNDSLNLESN